MSIKDFLSSSNKNKTLQMCTFISILIAIQGIVMGFVNLKTSNTLQVAIPFTYGIVMAINFIYILLTKKLNLFYISAVIIIFGLEYSFLISGGTEGFGLIWLTVIPLFTVYLLTPAFFYICNSIFYIILLAAMYTPLNAYVYDFNHNFEIRFPLVYGLAFLFGAFLKYRITKTENDLEIQKNLLATEIHQAAIIQQTFFKQPILDFEKWEIAIKNMPMAEVTGDMYDIYTENSKLDGIGLFDISGHGISSGLITMLSKNIIHQEFYANINSDLQSTVNNINNRIIREKGDIENYLTGIMIRNFDDHIDVVNAGHPSPIIYKANSKTLQVLERDPSAMGAIGIKYLPSVFITQSVPFESGDEIIIFTDGLLELKDNNKNLLGIKRLMNTLKKAVELAPERQIDFITAELKAFSNDSIQEDDVTFVILKKK